MREDTDHFRLLAAIGGKPALFPACANIARKAVNDMVRAQLVVETSSLDVVKEMHALLGAAAFAEALDGVPAPKTKALLGRVDPHAPPLAQPSDRIKALLALAAGTLMPSAPAEKAPRKSARKAAAPKAPPEAKTGAEEGEAKSRPRRRISGRAALRVSEDR